MATSRSWPRALFLCVTVAAVVAGQATTRTIPFSDAESIFKDLREDVWPAELRGKTLDQVEAAWPAWLSSRDAAIRARVQEGDEDSLINLLQFGTSFTSRPRITDSAPAGIVVRQTATGATAFLASPLLKARIDDFVTAVAMPGANERLQFARQVIDRRGIVVATEQGRAALKQYLEQRTSVVGSAVHAAALNDPATSLADQLTLFKDRGLASDTAIWIDFAVERALDDLKAAGHLEPGAVRRMAIVGPGLDFTDKQEGYDFYPQQTIQPFALIDSLSRLGLASPDLQLTAFDLSPRVLQHLEAARQRARAGTPYVLVLPRARNQNWNADVVRYWERFGDRIGASVTAAPPPSSAGPVTVRSLAVRPAIPLSIVPRDANIVVQRLAGMRESEQFDLVLATNILLYYDVFEQSLAVTNIAAMMRPGGVLLSNDRVFELPDGPIEAVGATDVRYTADAAGKADRINWYRRK